MGRVVSLVIFNGAMAMTKSCEGCFKARDAFNGSFTALRRGDVLQATDDLKEGFAAVLDVVVAKPMVKAGLKFRDILKTLKD
jgi:hypothetical protein